MPDVNSISQDFVDEHPLLLRLPCLIDDHSGIVSVSITLAFETVMIFADQIEKSSVNLYHALLRAYLPGKKLDSLMRATGCDQLINTRKSPPKLDAHFKRVQGAFRAISALGRRTKAPLTGIELYEKVASSELLKLPEVVLVCGYIGNNEDEEPVLQWSKFLDQNGPDYWEYLESLSPGSSSEDRFLEVPSEEEFFCSVSDIVEGLLDEYKILVFDLVDLFAGGSLYDRRQIDEIKSAFDKGLVRAVESPTCDLGQLEPLKSLLELKHVDEHNSAQATHHRSWSTVEEPSQGEQVGRISRIEDIWLASRREGTDEQDTGSSVEQHTGSSVEQRTKTLLRKLDNLTGLESVKLQIRELVQFCLLQQERSSHGLKVQRAGLHMVFTGNPGTGKTSVARLIGELMQGLGWLSKGHFTEVSRSDLVARFVGHTAIKTTEVLEKALGGVLFIDEAYMLTPGGELEADDDDTFGQEALDTILAYMENHRDDLLVIVAGYHEEMLRFLESNPGLRSRFTRFLQFADYNQTELAQIFEQMAAQQSYCLSPSCKQQLLTLMEQTLRHSRKGFGNGREVRNLFELTLTKQAARLASMSERSRDDLVTIMEDDLPLQRSAEIANDTPAASLAELNQLVGVEAVKQELRTLLNLLRVQQLRREQNMPVTEIGCHLVFAGNPGTGKTTVARILARELHRIGFCRDDRLVEVDRAGLVGGYTGQTALKVEQVVESALGGVLFIDEAYSLVSGKQNDFGQEAVDSLLKLMEDHRNDLVVIAAGYPEEMEVFLDANPGLRSRFSRTIHFCDYTVQELEFIFRGMLSEAGLSLEDAASPALTELLQKMKQEAGDRFANGRSVRQLFEYAQAKQADRLLSDNKSVPSPEDLKCIKHADISDYADVFAAPGF